MDRQHGGSLASLEGAAGMARQVARSLEQSGHLLLLGMGAAHTASYPLRYAPQLGRVLAQLQHYLGQSGI